MIRYGVYFTWRGRASRKTYWLYSLPLVDAFLLNEHFVEPDWFTLLLMVPIICLWPLIELGFLSGTDGSNPFTEACPL